MRYAIETCPLFFIGPGDIPRGILGICGIEHLVARPGIVIPALAGRQVHGAELPLAQRVLDTRRKPAFLFLVAHLEPEFEQGNSAFYNVLLKEWTKLEK